MFAIQFTILINAADEQFYHGINKQYFIICKSSHDSNEHIFFSFFCLFHFENEEMLAPTYNQKHMFHLCKIKIEIYGNNYGRKPKMRSSTVIRYKLLSCVKCTMWLIITVFALRTKEWKRVPILSPCRSHKRRDYRLNMDRVSHEAVLQCERVHFFMIDSIKKKPNKNKHTNWTAWRWLLEWWYNSLCYYDFFFLLLLVRFRYHCV